MEFYIRGKGKIILDKNDFVASGGEAKIYKQGNIAYKIFHKKSDMVPEAKINELSVLNKPNIIKPIDIILDKKNSSVGYSSDWIDGDPLCKLFVSSFRKREGIDDSHIIKLVTNIIDTIKYIHSQNILIVDGNELNYIVGKDFVTPYFIDVNSWQTKSFPATAIMDSIKDWTSNKFTQLTDWYSFAIVSCWLFVGVHPYKGKHHKYANAGDEIKKRCLDKVSIFNKDVVLAPNARINSIPSYFKDWYIDIFEKGKRTLPPDIPGTIQSVFVVATHIKYDNFIIKELRKFNNDILWVSRLNGILIVKTENAIYINNKEVSCGINTNIVLSPKTNVEILCEISNKKFKVFSKSNIKISGEPNASEIMIVNNHIYYRCENKFVELSVDEYNGIQNIMITTKQVWDIMPNSSKLFAGVIFQTMLDNMYISIPIPKEGGNSQFISKKLPELSNFKIIDAKYDNQVLAVCVFDKDYKIMIFRFDKTFDKYDVREIAISNIVDINMIVLDNGVAIIIPENEILEAFSNKPFEKDIKRIKDSSITTDMRLCKDLNKAMFFKDRILYSIQMK